MRSAGQPARTCRRCARSIACTCARREYRELADNLQRQLKLTAGSGARRWRCSCAWAHLREQNLGELGAAVDTYRRCSSWSRSTPRRSRRWSGSCQTRARAGGGAVARADLPAPRRLAEARWRVRDRGPPRRRSGAEDRAPARRSPRATSSASTIPSSAYEALARASAEDPLQPGDAAAHRTAGPRARQAEDLVARYEALVDQCLRPGAEEHALSQDRHAAESELRRDEQAAAAYPTALEVGRATSTAPTRWSSSTCAPRTTRSSSSCCCARRRSSRPPPKESSLPRRPDLRRGPRGLRAGDRGVPACCRVDETTGTRSTARAALHPARALGDLKDIYAKKAELATTPDEKKQMLFVLGQVYDRELQDPDARHRDLPDRSSTSIPTTSRPSRRSTGSTCRRSAGTTCSQSSSAQIELAPSPAEVVSLRFRIGELWREHLKDLGRAVEAYRQVLTMDPRTSRRCGAGGADAGRESRCWRPRSWSRSTRRRASGIASSPSTR